MTPELAISETVTTNLQCIRENFATNLPSIKEKITMTVVKYVDSRDEF